jgi:hypothetical protein
MFIDRRLVPLGAGSQARPRCELGASSSPLDYGVICPGLPARKPPHVLPQLYLHQLDLISQVST